MGFKAAVEIFHCINMVLNKMFKGKGNLSATFSSFHNILNASSGSVFEAVEVLHILFIKANVLTEHVNQFKWTYIRWL